MELSSNKGSTKKPNQELFKILATQFSLIKLKGKIPQEENWSQYCKTKRNYDDIHFSDSENAGITTGPASGILVLDVDNPELFKSVCSRYDWKIPETFRVRTGRGGMHYYFKYPSSGSYGQKSLPMLGFDTRGDGGQVVAPGSIHPTTGKMYKIENEGPIADPPEWLLQIYSGKNAGWTLIDPEKMKGSDDVRERIRKGVGKGNRSEAIMTVINSMVSSGYSDDQIYYIFYSYPIGEKFHEVGQRKDEWLKQQIDKAREFVSVQIPKESMPVQIEVDEEELKKIADQLLKQATVPCESFDTSLLPDVLRRYIESLCRATDTEPITMTVTVLSMVSSLVKKRCYMPEGEYFQKLYPNLWMLIINKSGTFKTTALKKGFALANEHEENSLEKINQLKISTDEKDTTEQIAKLMKDTPLLPNRTTGEGLLEHLSEGYGGAIVCSEFGDWLGTLEKNYNQGLKHS